MASNPFENDFQEAFGTIRSPSPPPSAGEIAPESAQPSSSSSATTTGTNYRMQPVADASSASTPPPPADTSDTSSSTSATPPPTAAAEPIRPVSVSLADTSSPKTSDSVLQMTLTTGKSAAALGVAKENRANTKWSGEWEKVAQEISASHSAMVISVTQPELLGSMLNRHIVYSVRTDPQGYSVRRRFSDFTWLREALVVGYPGLFIPNLPLTSSIFNRKKATGSRLDVDSDFIRNRNAQLQLFMRQICSIPFLRTDSSLKAFLSVQDEKEFETIVKSNSKGDLAIEETEGALAWQALLAQTPIPEDADRAVVDVKRQLDSMTKCLQQMEATIMYLGRCSVKFANTMTNFSANMVNWSDTEMDLSDPQRNECPNTYGPRVKVFMDAMNIGMGHWTTHSHLTPKLLATVVLAGIQYMMQQIEGFKEFLKSRETTAKDLERAEKEKTKAFEDKSAEKVRTSTRFSNFLSGGGIFGGNLPKEGKASASTA